MARKRYFENISRKKVYGGLGVLLIIALGLFLFVPHYKPLKLASQDQINQAHHDIITSYFTSSTTCKNDSRTPQERIAEFNKYFKVNKYANRAVLRGCNDTDTMLEKADNGRWLKTDVNIVLSSRQNPVWQKACLIDDITTADTKVRPENGSIDAGNLAVCDKLRKESYVHI